MTGKVAGARDLADLQKHEARQSLQRLGQWIYPTVQLRRFSTETFWEVSFRSVIKVCDRDGDWTLHGTWRYWDEPSTGRGLLRESSLGVTVAACPSEEVPASFCLARYDVELHGNQRGRHLNLFQPLIGDAVHWIVTDEHRYEDWPLEATLRFLIEDLCHELTQAGWPAAGA